MGHIKYISLFTGGFGLDLGLEAAGFEPAVCVEIGTAMRQTIRYNRPHIKVIGDLEDEAGGDLCKLTTDFILKQADLQVGDVDLVVGGPPCQSFSILGKRQGISDARGTLMLEFVRVVKEAKPKCFIMENVVGFLNVDKGSTFLQIKTLFEQEKVNKEVGYRVSLWRLNSVDFGVPQYRERIFLVGIRNDLPYQPSLQPPEPTHRSPDCETKTLFDKQNNYPTYRCVQDVLKNMPPNLPNNEPRLHGERVKQRYAALAQGSRDKVDHTDRLSWDRPSGTVLVGSSHGGGRPFIHPEEPRHITVREAARLQSFPDDWFFCGGPTAQYRQVGNAVPPRLAEAVGNRIAAYFKDLEAFTKPQSHTAQNLPRYFNSKESRSSELKTEATAH